MQRNILHHYKIIFQDYMNQFLAPIFEKAGGLEIPSFKADLLDYIKLQVLVASKACRFEVANCVTHSQKLFHKMKSNAKAENL